MVLLDFNGLEEVPSISGLKYVTHDACLRCASLGLSCCSRCRPFVLLEDLRTMSRTHSEDEVLEIVEVDVVPAMYLHHLSDPEMAQIYYRWGGKHYRLQTKFVNGSCVALVPGKGCALRESRPLICKVWPFWWRSGSNPSTGDFQLEVDGDCTMVTQWNMTVDEVLRELGLSEVLVKRELLALHEALREHCRALARARAMGIPPRQLLSWMLREAQLKRHALT